MIAVGEEPPGERGQWRPGPRSPRMASGEVHVWIADLDRLDESSPDLLSDAELARAERFLKPREGARWGRAHGLLRSLLGAYLEESPAALRFAESESGKPALAWPAPQAPISFNISHSGRLGLFAFAHARVGVDVELDRRPIDEAALARRAFSRDAARRIATLAPARRREEFLREWARREAALKCLGAGIGAATPGRGTADARLQPLWLCDLRLPARGGAALACDSAPLEVWCWTPTAVR